MDQPDLVDAVESLTAKVGELSQKVNMQQAVVNAIKKQRADLRSTRIVLAAAVFGIVLDLALTAGFGLLYRQVEHNQRQIQAVQQRTSSEILCPLYQVFALSIKINPPPANYNQEQRELRQHAADTILAGLDKLGCA